MQTELDNKKKLFKALLKTRVEYRPTAHQNTFHGLMALEYASFGASGRRGVSTLSPSPPGSLRHSIWPQVLQCKTRVLQCTPQGFLGKKNSHGATARALRHARSPQRVHRDFFAPRPRRSPQRVHPGMSKTQKTSSCCTSTTPIPAEGPARAHRQKRKTKTSSFCTSTTPIPAEGRIPDRRQHPHPPPRKRFLIPSSFSFFPAR